MSRIFEALTNFRDDRPAMKANDSVDSLLALLLQEVDELKQEPEGMSREKYIIQELSDVAIFSINLLNLLTNDKAEDALMEKVCRNTLKYPAVLWQQGDYETSMTLSKKQWTKEDNREFYE